MSRGLEKESADEQVQTEQQVWDKRISRKLSAHHNDLCMFQEKARSF